MNRPLALIIEDDPKLGDIFVLAMQAAAFETILIMDGEAACTQLAEVVPAVIVLDLHLPYVSGSELLQQIRTDERLAKTQVILATADALLADQLKEKSDTVLLKPISPVKLRHVAQNLRPIWD